MDRAGFRGNRTRNWASFRGRPLAAGGCQLAVAVNVNAARTWQPPRCWAGSRLKKVSETGLAVWTKI
jgi:hypothetical protein